MRFHKAAKPLVGNVEAAGEAFHRNQRINPTRIQAGCLDRLHVMVAPLILGAGRATFAFGAIDRIEEALHLLARAHPLGRDILFDCDLSAHRVLVWRAQAKKSIY
jgi:hypothetical protein